MWPGSRGPPSPSGSPASWASRRYLAAWRMQLAAIRLVDQSRSIAELGFELGYESEAAFNRAFKRHHGLPPATWRAERFGV